MNKTLQIAIETVSSDTPYSIDFRVPEADIRPDHVESIRLSHADLRGTLQQIDTEYLFEGEVTGNYSLNCDRCLEPTEAQVTLHVTWLFGDAASTESSAESESNSVDLAEADDNSDIRYLYGEHIDFAAPIWEELVMAAPNKVHCGEQCKGLCPQCGRNLNTGTCSCAGNSPSGSGSFDALKDLLPDLPSGSAAADET